jgi:hypothetical protein
MFESNWKYVTTMKHMQEEDTRLMIGTWLRMFIHERSRIKFSSNNDIYKTF